MELVKFIDGLELLIETAEGEGLAREDVICELESKIAELRGDQENDWKIENPVAFMPLP